VPRGRERVARRRPGGDEPARKDRGDHKRAKDGTEVGRGRVERPGGLRRLGEAAAPHRRVVTTSSRGLFRRWCAPAYLQSGAEGVSRW
jgi:hypothetical protein